jgi:hypothetical protein
LTTPLPPSAGLLAYGPAPEMELIPYFLGLLTWAGLALAAFILWPVSALFRRLRRKKDQGQSTKEAKEAGEPTG